MGIEKPLPRIRLTATPPKPLESVAGSSRAEILMAKVAALETRLARLEVRLADLAPGVPLQASAYPVKGLTDILAEVCATFGVPPGNVMGARSNPVARAVKLAFVAKARAAGFTFEDMAGALNVSINALRVYTARARRAAK